MAKMIPTRRTRPAKKVTRSLLEASRGGFNPAANLGKYHHKPKKVH